MELAKQKNYQHTFDLACASIREMDLRERAGKAGAEYRKEGQAERVTLPFFSGACEICFPEVEFLSPSGKTVSLVARILLLHYLIRADGMPLAGRWVAYQDIPGALLYGGVFARRVTEPLERRFGGSAKVLREAGARMGGTKDETADASFTLRALPRVPLQGVLWEADEEFPPKAQLLFDASVDHYLSLEDIVVLGQLTTGRLIHASTHLLGEGDSEGTG